jgi:hypothetical protein
VQQNSGSHPPNTVDFSEVDEEPGVLMARQTLLLLLTSLLIFAVAVPAVAGSFTDVPDSNVFADDIEWLAAEGITAGCNPPTNDNFCPNKAVTRGQMAAFLVRALGLTDSGDGNHFTDDNNSVFENDIDKLYTAGITQGCNPPTNDMYCPSKAVTRRQMAAFLRRALDVPPAIVTGLVVTFSGGSGEVYVSWDANTETDLDHYNVWFSELSGDTKTLVAGPFYEGPAVEASGRIYVIDWPRPQAAGESCYQISAVDTGGLEGPRSVEDCFDPAPGTPTQVMNVTVGLAGGSGEAYVSWTPNSEGDIHFYNLYFSFEAGGPYTYHTSVNDTVRNGSNRVFLIDYPVDLTDGKSCYVITAVDYNEKEGPASVKSCFDSTI